MYSFNPRRFRYNRRVGGGCCLGGLLRLVLVGLGVKYLVDRSRDQQSTQVWPPQREAQGQPLGTPSQPQEGTGKQTTKLNEGEVDPWVDKA